MANADTDSPLSTRFRIPNFISNWKRLFHILCFTIILRTRNLRSLICRHYDISINLKKKVSIRVETEHVECMKTTWELCVRQCCALHSAILDFHPPSLPCIHHHSTPSPLSGHSQFKLVCLDFFFLHLVHNQSRYLWTNSTHV